MTKPCVREGVLRSRQKLREGKRGRGREIQGRNRESDKGGGGTKGQVGAEGGREGKEDGNAR